MAMDYSGPFGDSGGAEVTTTSVGGAPDASATGSEWAITSTGSTDAGAASESVIDRQLAGTGWTRDDVELVITTLSVAVGMAALIGVGVAYRGDA